MKISRFTRLAAVAAAMAMVVSACSSATDDKDEAKAEPSSKCAVDAKAAVAKWAAPVELVGPSQKVDMSASAGKEFWLILTVTNQFSAAVADGFKAAATAAGVKPVVFDGKGTATEWNKGLNQAVSRNAGGIVLWGVPPALVSEGVAAAKAKNIPVIDSVNGSITDDLQPGIAAHVDINAEEWGTALAHWWLAESDCKANVGVIWPPSYGGLDKIAKSAQATLKQECESCKFVKTEMDVANLATTLPEQVRTMLTANPELNFVTPLFDSAVSFAAPIVSQFKDVQIGSHDGVETSLKMVRDGGPQTMDMTYPPNDYLGWMYVSILGGMNAGLEPDPSLLRIPERLVTTDTIPATDAEIWSTFDGFEDTFKASWTK